MTTLLDTNILIDYFREKPSAVLFVEGLNRKPSVSVCTVMELMAGARNQQEEGQIESLPRSASIIPVTLDIARIAGQHVKHYRRSHGLDDLDALIAATAVHHGLKLATINVKHFPMLKGLKRAY